ncbi:MAG: capsid cement protein [Cyanobacteria bacterium J06638_20]
MSFQKVRAISLPVASETVITRGRGVSIDSSGNAVQVTASTDFPVGVALEDSAVGVEAALPVAELKDAVIEVQAGAAILAGAELMFGLDGRVIESTGSPAFGIGIALDSVAENGFLRMVTSTPLEGSALAQAQAFTTQIATAGWYAASTQPAAIYNSTTNQTLIAYSTVDAGDDLGIFTHIKAYDHTGDVWLPSFAVGRRHNVTDNNHGMPALAINGDGRIVVFYGSHNGGSDGEYYMAVSMNPGDIFRWSEVFAISGEYTYPHPVTLSDGSIGVFFRERVFPGAEFPAGAYPIRYRNISFSGVTPTIGPEVDVGNFGNDSRAYMGSTIYVSDTEVHMVASRAPFNDAWRRDVYLMLHDITNQQTRSYDGLITHSWPLSAANLNDFRVYEHDDSVDPNVTGNVPFMVYQGSGNWVVTFNVGETPGVAGGFSTSPQEFFAMDVSVARGPEAPFKLADGDQRYESVPLGLRSNGDIVAYISTEENLRGGGVQRRVNSEGVWGPLELVQEYDNTKGPLFQLYALQDPGPIEAIWSEISLGSTNALARGGNAGFAVGPTSYFGRTVATPGLPSGLELAYDCNDPSTMFSDLAGSTAVTDADGSVVQSVQDITGNGNLLVKSAGGSQNAFLRKERSGDYLQIGRQNDNVGNDIVVGPFNVDATNLLSDGEGYIAMAVRVLNFEDGGHVFSMDEGSGANRGFIMAYDQPNRRPRLVVHNTGGDNIEPLEGFMMPAQDLIIGAYFQGGVVSLRWNSTPLGVNTSPMSIFPSLALYIGAQNSTLNAPCAMRLYRAAAKVGHVSLAEATEIDAWLAAGADQLN